MKGNCSVCLLYQELEGHHIYLRSDKRFLKREKLNVILLCKQCHDEAHESPSKFREMLRSYDPERMEKLDLMAETMGKVNQIRRLG